MASQGSIDLGIEGITDAVRVGQGSFGTVYRATQEAYGRTVAVKVLSAPLADEQSRKAFDRECRALGTISDHPGIVTLYAAGISAGDRPYLIMEFLSGGSLADVVASGPMPWEQAVAIGIKIAGALATAHAAGVLHRDIKPENVLLSGYNEPELADFGVAKVQGGTHTTMGMITGSIAYAAPEVLSGVPATEASDVWGLACTIATILSGASPFHRDGEQTLQPLLMRIITAEPNDLRPLGVPEDVNQVVVAALAKDTWERTPTAVAFGEALQQVQQGRGLAVTPLTVRRSSDAAVTAAVPDPLPAPATPTPVAPDTRVAPVEEEAATHRRIAPLTGIAAPAPTAAPPTPAGRRWRRKPKAPASVGSTAASPPAAPPTPATPPPATAWPAPATPPPMPATARPAPTTPPPATPPPLPATARPAPATPPPVTPPAASQPPLAAAARLAPATAPPPTPPPAAARPLPATPPPAAPPPAVARSVPATPPPAASPPAAAPPAPFVPAAPPPTTPPATTSPTPTTPPAAGAPPGRDGPPSRLGGRGRWIAAAAAAAGAAAVVVLAIVVLGGHGKSPRRSSVTAATSPSTRATAPTTTPTTAPPIRPAFADDFSNPASGWAPDLNQDGNGTASYKPDGYHVTALKPMPALNTFSAASPYQPRLLSLSVTVTATLTGAPADGLGVRCDEGDRAHLRYTFEIHGDGSWVVFKLGDLSAALLQGQSPNVINTGSHSNLITGTCTEVGVGATKLTMIVNGVTLGTVTDPHPGQIPWHAALVVYRSTPTVATDARFNSFQTVANAS